MVDKCVVINMLILVSYHTTIAETLTTLTFKDKVEHISGYSIMQRDDVMTCS